MKSIATLCVVSVLGVASAWAANTAPRHSLACDIVEDDDKIIRCTFASDRLAADRTLLFTWRSETTPQDDRERTVILPAGHGSVYDYRYYYGRAPGIWKVTVSDEAGNALADTSITVE